MRKYIIHRDKSRPSGSRRLLAVGRTCWGLYSPGDSSDSNRTVCHAITYLPEDNERTRPEHFAAGGASASSFRASDNLCARSDSLRTRSDNLTGKIGKVENILPIPRSGRSFRFVAADAEFIYNELCPEWMLPALAGSFADSSPERISERFVCAENVRGRFNRNYCASKSWKIAR